jgi:hypothetical protein
MDASGSKKLALHRGAALLVLVGLALTGCQATAAQGGAARNAPAGRPAVIESITPADRAAERIDRERADRGFLPGCRQHILVEHETWRVVCVAPGR